MEYARFDAMGLAVMDEDGDQDRHCVGLTAILICLRHIPRSEAGVEALSSTWSETAPEYRDLAEPEKRTEKRSCDHESWCHNFSVTVRIARALTSAH